MCFLYFYDDLDCISHIITLLISYTGTFCAVFLSIMCWRCLFVECLVSQSSPRGHVLRLFVCPHLSICCYGSLQVSQEKGDQFILLWTPCERMRALPCFQPQQGTWGGGVGACNVSWCLFEDCSFSLTFCVSTCCFPVYCTVLSAMASGQRLQPKLHSVQYSTEHTGHSQTDLLWWDCPVIHTCSRWFLQEFI